MGFLGGTVVKNPPANAEDVGSIPGSGRSLGDGEWCWDLTNAMIGFRD